jgi:hypothetical protein
VPRLKPGSLRDWQELLRPVVRRCQTALPPDQRVPNLTVPSQTARNQQARSQTARNQQARNQRLLNQQAQNQKVMHQKVQDRLKVPTQSSKCRRPKERLQEVPQGEWAPPGKRRWSGCFASQKQLSQW